MQKIVFGISGAGDHFLTIALERKPKSPLRNKVFPTGRHLLYFQYSVDEKMSSKYDSGLDQNESHQESS